MNERQRIDTIAESARQMIQDEISSLLGTTFLLTQPEGRLVSKRDFLDKMTGNRSPQR